jgi:hypothetical protein
MTRAPKVACNAHGEKRWVKDSGVDENGRAWWYCPWCVTPQIAQVCDNPGCEVFRFI